MRFRLRTLLILLAAISVLCAVARRYFVTTYGRGVNALEANRQLWICSVPESAIDVCFTTSYSSSEVEFTTDERSLRAWCLKHGYTPQPVNPVSGHAVVSQKGEAVAVTNGLFFFRDTREEICYGLYDSVNSRAFLIIKRH